LEEPDGRFFLHCFRSSSERQLIIALGSKTTSESWFIDAEQPQQAPRCLAPREEDHEYHVDHGLLDGQWRWFIRSNQSGINFALYTASEEAYQRPHWQELVAHDPEVMIEDLTLLEGGWTLGLRIGGLQIVEVHPAGADSYRVALPDAAYSLH